MPIADIYSRFSLLLLMLSCFVVTGCLNEKPPETPARRIISDQQSYDFVKDIKPVLNNKCIVCHACYDAPCQLKLESGEGLERGASRLSVYDAKRLQDATPTRLFVDADTPAGWRELGFYSVLAGAGTADASIIEKMLTLGKANPLPADKPVPDAIKLGFERKLSCPDSSEFADYKKDNPHGGMPLAMAGLQQNEYQMLTTWLAEGGKTGTLELPVSADESSLIESWEAWFNQTDRRSQLVARYLFEHLFLAHLYLVTDNQGKPQNFFELVRSSTPPGQPVKPVKTARPNDKPDGKFYYRLTPIRETIVHKTHITYLFDQARLQHYQSLFLEGDWEVEQLPGYDYAARANPFTTFQAIPARSRYQFLLDEAEYFVRTFIRGPVCRGQIATNVIRDHFWVMFEDPDHELYVSNAEYRATVSPLLGLPGEKTSLSKLGPEWLRYLKDRNRYLDHRQKQYRQDFSAGAEKQHIWDGDGNNSNAYLTVFRHHDSASVTRGWSGQIPLTTWWMDYPLLERTYYELVVGFNVFGSLSHQVQTRLYFDLIRNGSESNFLRMMPPASRQNIYSDWYQDSGKIKDLIAYHDLDVDTPVNINYASDKPYQELLRTQLASRKVLADSTDLINRCGQNCEDEAETTAKALSAIAAVPRKKLAAMAYLPEVTFLRVRNDQGDDSAYTILRNRRHSNVAFMLAESLRYQEDLETLTIVPGLIGSYPNLMLSVKAGEIESFASGFARIESEKQFKAWLAGWAVHRTDAQIWDLLAFFHQYMRHNKPLQAGIYDLNRYGHW